GAAAALACIRTAGDDVVAAQSGSRHRDLDALVRSDRLARPRGHTPGADRARRAVDAPDAARSAGRGLRPVVIASDRERRRAAVARDARRGGATVAAGGAR